MNNKKQIHLNSMHNHLNYHLLIISFDQVKYSQDTKPKI